MKKLLALTLLFLSLGILAQEPTSDEFLSLPAGESDMSYETETDGTLYYDDSGDSYYDEEYYPENEFNGMDSLIAMSGGIVFAIFISVFYAVMLIAPYIV